MKKYLFLLFLLVAAGSRAQDVQIAVDEVEAVPGETLNFSLRLLCEPNRWKGFEFNIELPTGITYTRQSQVNATRWPNGSLSMGGLKIIAVDLGGGKIQGDAFDEIAAIEINVDESVTVGNYTGKITNFLIVDGSDHTESCGDITFNIHVVEKHTILLDETSTTLPSDASGVNVLVKRTLKADEWSTIVLPFEMSATQWKDVFGEDAHLMEFTGYEAEENAAGDITNISVKFSEVAASGTFEANHPYVLKVSSNISEFTVEDVDIEVEEEPVVATVKRSRRQWSELIGTYVANTVVPESTLFLSGNKFWYSRGLTKMMGMRAYFDFYDVLTDVEGSSVKALMDFNDEPTVIIDLKERTASNVYGVDGLYYGDHVNLDRLPKGIYIVNGKKVFKNK